MNHLEHMLISYGQPYGVPYRILLFDADGTLRECTIPGQPCPNQAGEWILKDNVQSILSRFDWNLTGISVISNQGGVGLGYLTLETAYQLIADAIQLATSRFPPVGSIFICPHEPSVRCDCRKPHPMMLLDAARYWLDKGAGTSIRQCLYVGDMDSDLEAAVAADIDFIWAKDFFRWDDR